MQTPDYVLSYRALLEKLLREHGRERAMELIVGGDYYGAGAREAAALRELGLQPEHSVIDIGCGSGRLAFQLRTFLKGKYLGTDLLDEALTYAREKCARPDWEFVTNYRPTIPAPAATADWVTFFSVFTHLLDEDCFKFLLEARRVLKPGGKVVFSYLDYGCDMHWPVFLRTVADEDPKRVLNKFINGDIIRRWARAAGLRIELLYDGAEAWIPPWEPGLAEPGTRVSSTLGQSLAVLSAFPEEAYLQRYPDVRLAVAAGTFQSAAHHYDICGHREERLL